MTSKSALAVTPSDVKRAKGEVNDFISWLEAQEIPSADVAGIRDSLEYYKLGIDQIRSSQDSLNSALWLAKIGADARSKRKYFSQNMGASSGSAFVEISVRTKSDAPPQEVTNITVGYILDGYPFEDIRYRRMLSASTPVVGFRILPGEYVFFALKADKVIGRKVTQIGLSGVNSTDVDIPVVGN